MLRSWKKLWLIGAGIAAVALTFFVITNIFADAGNPIVNTIHGNIVNNPDGTATVFVRGQWNWLTHGSDCNTDRAATGVGMVWNDPTEPGYLVTKTSGGVTVAAKVGVSQVRGSSDGPEGTVPANTVDQMVHPVDIGNKATDTYLDQNGVSRHDANAPQAGLSPQVFSDPVPFASTSTADLTATVANWKGGCGREPLSAPCGINSDAVGHPCGSWGYQKTYTDSHGNPQTGYAHTFASRADITTVCANFYDVHGGGSATSSTFQVPKPVTDIVVGPSSVTHSKDNSIETNAFNVSQGANCISFPQSGLFLTKTPDAPEVDYGSPIGFALKIGNTSATTDATNVTIEDQGYDPSLSEDGAGAGTCGDGIDNGNDGQADAADNDCFSTTFALPNSVYDPSLSDDGTVTGNPPHGDGTCGTGTDSNTNGLTGSDEPNCHRSAGLDWSVQKNSSTGNCVATGGVAASSCHVTGFTGAGDCVLSGSPPNEHLKCTVGTVPKGTTTAAFVVHLTSATTRQAIGDCSTGSKFDNTAVAHSDSQDANAPGSASVTVDCPSTTLDKSVNAPADVKINATYTYVETNNGNVALHDVGVTDDKCGPVTSLDTGDLAAGTSRTFTCTHQYTMFAGGTGQDCNAAGDTCDFINTAIGSGTSPLNHVVTFCGTSPAGGRICNDHETDSTTLHIQIIQ